MNDEEFEKYIYNLSKEEYASLEKQVAQFDISSKKKETYQQYKKRMALLFDELMEDVNDFFDCVSQKHLDIINGDGGCHIWDGIANLHDEILSQGYREQCVKCCKFTSIFKGAIGGIEEEYGHTWLELTCPKCQKV